MVSPSYGKNREIAAELLTMQKHVAKARKPSLRCIFRKDIADHKPPCPTCLEVKSIWPHYEASSRFYRSALRSFFSQRIPLHPLSSESE